MSAIHVEDLRNPASIAAAFQRALELVATPENVEEVLTNPLSTQKYIFVHRGPKQPNLGAIFMCPGRRAGTISVMLFVYFGHKPRAVAINPPLREELLGHLALRFESTSKPTRVQPLLYDSKGDWYMAELSDIPAHEMRTRRNLRVVSR
jgi:hypothetical protein